MTTINHKKNFILLALASLLALSAVAFASVTATRIPTIFKYSGLNSFGRAVAVGPEGNVYVAGDYFDAGTTGYDIRVARLNPGLMTQKWGTSYNAGLTEAVRAIAADSNYVYVLGMGATGKSDGYISAFRVTTGAHVWDFTKSMDYGFRGIALDPVDGSIWSVGGLSGTGLLARVSTAGSALGQNSITHAALASEGRSLAVTKDRVFVGGYVVNPGDLPWVYCLDRATRTKIYSKVFAAAAGSYVASVAPVGNEAYALITDLDGGNGKLVWLDASGNERGRVALYSGAGDAFIGPQQVVAHPTLPILFVVAGYQKNVLRAYDLGLNLLWNEVAISPVEGVATMDFIAGVAVLPGLNSAVYVVGQQNIGGGASFHMLAGGFTLGNAEITGDKLVVAPNRLNLGGIRREVSFIVRDDAGKNVSLQVFDAAGRIVKTIPGVVGANGICEVRWDGTGGTSGILLAPGLYWVRVEGGKDIKPLMITTEVK